MSADHAYKQESLQLWRFCDKIVSYVCCCNY
jgi:hypothetical protein